MSNKEIIEYIYSELDLIDLDCGAYNCLFSKNKNKQKTNDSCRCLSNHHPRVAKVMRFLVFNKEIFKNNN